MISYIIGGILLIYILIRRFSQNGKVADYPLGMPRGTVRALIALMIVSFPFGYLMVGKEIPGLIINLIFIVVAFYFEARRSEKEKLMHIVQELKGSDLDLNDKREKKPLYLPKYTVRVSLIAILVLIILINWFGPQVPFQQTNTLVDLLLILGFFLIGAIFRSISKIREKRKIRTELKEMDASLSDAEIIEKLMLREPNWFKSTGRSIISIFVLIAITLALICYTFEIDYTIFTLTTLDNYQLTVVGLLLIFTNAYYGFRD